MSFKKESSNIIRLAHGAGGQLQEELIEFITKNIPFKKHDENEENVVHEKKQLFPRLESKIFLFQKRTVAMIT